MATGRSPLITGNQYGLAVGASVVTLTVPAAASAAEIYVRDAAIVFTRTGTDPTSTKGFQADIGDIIMLNSRQEMTRFEAIRVSASATIDVEYFTALAG